MTRPWRQRAAWEEAAAFQPLRELIERALVAYDWGESFIVFSLDEDAHWHRGWTAALIRHIVDDNTANAEVVSGWIEKWSPPASEALEAFASVTAEAPVPFDPSAVAARITDEVTRELGAAL
jgi:toluene monooxygenase system protein E